MKVVILAGGLPSSISDEAEGIPKPMVEIGGRPLLWHIMKHYSYYGYNEFLICGGYKINLIKDYFNDFYAYQSDITVNLQNNSVELHNNITEEWKVMIVDTGLTASTGSRISHLERYLNGENFIINYGDCITDININAMVETFHKRNKVVTLAMARPAGRNVIINVDAEGNYCGIESKENLDSWTNANVLVCDGQVFHYLKEDEALEKGMLEYLAKSGQVATYRHNGFWMPVETIRDRTDLEKMWSNHMEPWKAR